MSTTEAPQAPPPAQVPPIPSAAAKVAGDVLIELRRGRVATATAMLEGLPAMIHTKLNETVRAAAVLSAAEAYLRGQKDLVDKIAAAEAVAKPKRPRPPKRPRSR